MVDLWKKVPKQDWKIANFLTYKIRPVYHRTDEYQGISYGTWCPTPEICGRYCHKTPWTDEVQKQINFLKSKGLRL